jgi:hypothetical protein
MMVCQTLVTGRLGRSRRASVRCTILASTGGPLRGYKPHGVLRPARSQRISPSLQALFDLFRGFEHPTLPLSAPGRSVVSQSMTTARPGVSMVRAQLTAWSERRSQGGGGGDHGKVSSRGVLGGGVE